MRHRVRPAYGKNYRALKAIKNSRGGETCVIIGNGTSINELKHEDLCGLPAFCLNRGYLLWQKWQESPTYLVCVNDQVLNQFAAELKLVEAQQFFPWDQSYLFEKTSNTNFIETHWRPKFHRDVNTGTWLGGTVTFTAFQIAFHLGFKHVILVGVDHNFAFDGEPNQLIVSKGADPNHFCPSYFGNGVRWIGPDLKLSEVSYQMAREVFEADGRRITDATSGGSLDVFPKAKSIAEAAAISV